MGREPITDAKTMWELIDRRAQSDGDRTMLIDERDNVMTFGQFRDEAEKVVQRLMEELDACDVELPDATTIKMPARSWGIASYPLDGKTAKALVENADTRAYARKRARSEGAH